jgi:hypothetical protein
MFVLYLDEFGHNGPYVPTNPRFAHHPFFGFAGMAIEGPKWHSLDRSFLRLKKSFYAPEIARAAVLKGLRPERWEPKQLRSPRDIRFAAGVLRLVESHGGMVIAHGFIKNTTPANHNYHGVYASNLQGSLKSFDRFLRKGVLGRNRGRGLVIMDRRIESLNQLVLASAQSFLFAYLGGPNLRIVETPLLVPSEWYHGVQIADVIGRAVSAVYRFRHLNDANFQAFDKALGPLVDRCEYVDGAWRSVHIF